MANNIRLAASMDDKVSGPLDRLRGKVDSLGKTGAGKGLLAGIAGAATLGAIGLVTGAVSALTDALGDAAKAYREDEASQARLRTSLEANVPAYNGNTDAIEKVLSSRMRLGFSDDEQRASLAQLVTRTHDSTKALEIQQTAMDLARLKGISLEAATNLLGKAYSGNVGALTRAGIAVDKNATATEALAAVQKAAQGQAESFANTNAGRLAASQVKVGESMERVGLVVARVADAVLPVLADGFEAIVNVLAEVGAAVERFLAENKPLVDFLKQAGEVYIKALVEWWKILATIISETVGVIADVVGTLADTFRTVIGGIIGTVRNMMEVAAEIPGPWQEGAAAIAASLAETEDAVESWGKNTSSLAGKAADDIVGNVSTGLAGGAGTVGDAAEEGLGDPIADGVQDGHDEAVKVAAKTPSDIANALRDKRTAWQQAVDQLGDDIENGMSAAAEAAKIKATLAGDNIQRGLKSKDPVIRAQAEATKKILTDRLDELARVATAEGRRTSGNFGAGITAKQNAVKVAADALKRAGRRPLVDMADDAEQWGKNSGGGYAKGLRSQAAIVAAAAAYLAQRAADNLRVQSPAKEGPLSKGGGPEGWGERFGDLYGKGLKQTLPDVARMLTAVRSAPATRLTDSIAPVRRMGERAGPLTGGDVLHVHFHTLTTPTAAQRQELEAMLTPIVVGGLQKRRLVTRAGTF
jgi:hypothetical protein